MQFSGNPLPLVHQLPVDLELTHFQPVALPVDRPGDAEDDQYGDEDGCTHKPPRLPPGWADDDHDLFVKGPRGIEDRAAGNVEPIAAGLQDIADARGLGSGLPRS